jgi:hypothetical protein
VAFSEYAHFSKPKQVVYVKVGAASQGSRIGETVLKGPHPRAPISVTLLIPETLLDGVPLTRT